MFFREPFGQSDYLRYQILPGSDERNSVELKRVTTQPTESSANYRGSAESKAAYLEKILKSKHLLYDLKQAVKHNASLKELKQALQRRNEKPEEKHRILMQLIFHTDEEKDENFSRIRREYYLSTIPMLMSDPKTQLENLNQAILHGATFNVVKRSLSERLAYLLEKWAYRHWENTNENTQLFRQDVFLSKLPANGRELDSESKKEMHRALNSFLDAGEDITPLEGIVPLDVWQEVLQSRSQPRMLKI
jgi:hypothetical protein